MTKTDQPFWVGCIKICAEIWEVTGLRSGRFFSSGSDETEEVLKSLWIGDTKAMLAAATVRQDTKRSIIEDHALFFVLRAGRQRSNGS